MNKFTDFLIKQRKILLALTLIITAISIYFIPQVVVNSDMTKYLPEDSQLRIGLEVARAEFGPDTPVLNVMIEAATEEKLIYFKSELEASITVDNIIFDATSDRHVQGDYTLLLFHLDAEATDDEQAQTVTQVENLLEGHTFHLSGTAYGINPMPNMMLITVPAVIILIIVLLAMCKSWIEPLIFFINIGIAVAINMGTNVIFPHISEVTQMIAALLQVVLSMDYAIIFLNRYRMEKQHAPDGRVALKNTFKNTFSPISGIAVTTTFGMLTLLIMSFTIGQDIGLVIAKGVVISFLTVFTVMPALIMATDKLMEKTEKPTLKLSMSGIGRLSDKLKFAIFGLFIVLFAAGFVLTNRMEITYSEADFDPIHQNFQLDNNFVVLHEIGEEIDLSFALDNPHVTAIHAYETTIGQALTPPELTFAMGMELELIEQLFMAREMITGESTTAMSMLDFIDFLLNDLSSNDFGTTGLDLDVQSLAMLQATYEELNQVRETFIGPNMARIMIETTFDVESDETSMFITQLKSYMDQNLYGRSYVLGESIMPYEMATSFPGEYALITWVMIGAFFVILLGTFRSIPLALILAIVIQATVFITMGAASLVSGTIMYLPLIIAQILLKGRVIDYGILYTANFVEARAEVDAQKATTRALNASIDTILTSGLIIVLMTFIIGLIFLGVDPAIAEILLLIAKGCFIGILLSVFALPGILLVFDKWIK